METRVYIPEFSSREINSPGEPGIFYHMGIGFTSSQIPNSATPAKNILADMGERAYRRNRSVIERVNAYLAPVTLDYDADVLPLTPSGNATERHMCAAYLRKASDTVDDPVEFWADKLQTDYNDVATIIENGPAIQNLVRSKLMKRGGVGYVQPGPDTFPSIEEVNQVIVASGALPCATWLDGTSAGEQAEEELLSLLIDKGVVAINIIPDRNWNIEDQKIKAEKVQKLYKVVNLARSLDLPVHVGTEMNAFGRKKIDDFDTSELQPLRDDFMKGAYFIYGHTVLQRSGNMGYQSQWTKQHFSTRYERNQFYTQIGVLASPGIKIMQSLRETLTPELTPSQVLRQLGKQ
jgi:hypothetical protein